MATLEVHVTDAVGMSDYFDTLERGERLHTDGNDTLLEWVSRVD